MQTKGNTNDFAVGMSNVPSDALCPDNAAAIEYNLIFRNGEHHPIQQPVYPHAGYVGDKLENVHCLYIHSYNKYKRYIGVQEDGVHSRLVWHDYDDVENTSTQLTDFDVEVREVKGITSIGNTLIVSLSTQNHESLHYFLWKPKQKKYIYLGTKLPFPDMNFLLLDKGITKNVLDCDGIIYTPLSGTGPAIKGNTLGQKENFNTLVLGLYAKNKQDIAKNKCFCNPFKIRYGLKLFDGSVTYLSAPIIMFPSVSENSYAEIYTQENDVTLFTRSCELLFKNNVDFTEYRDLVKSICVYVTKEIDVYDTSVDQSINYVAGEFICANNISGQRRTPIDNIKFNEFTETGFHSNSDFFWYNSLVLTKKKESTLINDIAEESVFYKLCEIDTLSLTDGYRSISNLVTTATITNITTSEQTENDDYYSRCDILPNTIYMYNNRLHLSNISRGFFEGFTSLMPLDRVNKYNNISSYVYIQTSDGERIVKHTFSTNECIHKYFYYPDPRAEKVEFFDVQGSHIITLNLKPHPLLNGAYFISDTLPDSNTHSESWMKENKSVPTVNTEPEQLQNEVWVSEVNNPFVFNASGVNTVGNGEILGIISNTTALSQGQFGQFPLYCFTTDGIYALETSPTGIYSSAHPLSREILDCTKSITATDSMIFFTSKKGLMALAGSEVRCVSEHLLGKTYKPTESEIEILNETNLELNVSFLDFLKDCFMAYDYRDKLLWIMNEDYYQIYVFSIESGAFSLTSLDEKPINVLNDYPDNIIQTKNNEYHLYSLIKRPNINADERTINAFIIGRPMKIGDSLTLKTPIEIKPIMDMDARKMKLRLFGLYNNFWSKILSVRGMGFKAFKYNLIFENLFPNETFSGIMEKWHVKFQGRFR